jgi:hypothetical protein
LTATDPPNHPRHVRLEFFQEFRRSRSIPFTDAARQEKKFV